MPSPSFKRSELGMYSTVSEQLKKAREAKGLTLAECARYLAIQEKYLSAIEESEYHRLPGELYARTWIQKYASFVGLSPKECMISYEKELRIRSKLQEKKVYSRKPRYGNVWELITLRRLAYAALVLIFFSYSGYLGYQTLRPPRVALNVPMNGFRTYENSIILKGQTEDGAEVRINHQLITLGAGRHFSQEITLTNGLNTITLSARKKHSLPFSASVVIVKTPPPAILTPSTTGPLISNE
ncbi:MAG: helix-turn-helix domain-containing protein [Candidatus Komeilibacteria bacterium]|nr:helix-turn-helix domain-containing protein [Candidatus Komeilibacteria bacterium]